jgi:hypothetical protein
MKLSGHYEEINGYHCFVENTRQGKVIHHQQPMSEYLKEVAKAKQLLKDLIELPREQFLQKYGK